MHTSSNVSSTAGEGCDVRSELVNQKKPKDVDSKV